MAYVETSSCLIEEIDEMVREGYYGSRTEAINDALMMLIKQYKLSKLHQKDQAILREEDGRKEDPHHEER